MKLKTRLIIAFFTVTLIPIVLSGAMIMLLGRYQMGAIEKTYGVTGATMESLSNPMQVLGGVTENLYNELHGMIEGEPEKLEDVTYLDEFNKKLIAKKAYLIVRKNRTVVYTGKDPEEAEEVIRQLPGYGGLGTTSKNGIYLGGEAQSLVKQIDFYYESGERGSAFIVTDVGNVIPEVQQFFTDMLLCIVLILVFTASILIFWIYKSIMRPLGKMEVAARRIKEGNLDFELKAESDDELGQLSMSLEDMRKRLKDNAEEKVSYDKENKELISNISHDLKTPITAIKGYVEGIIDGVADTQEKMDRYIRTIYNKANEMDTLINELTLYSQIDTNRIPYNFNRILVSDYFEDCVEELTLDLENKGIGLAYFNYAEEDMQIIADPEQLKRVIHNIVGNSVKYLDKQKGFINIRVRDVGDFIQVEIEDNGKGIAAKDLPYIFDRFYRTDTSRNSATGGSGIGLSIVKKIIEDHGGSIWATSKEHTGTIMYFVIRKYQEVWNE